MEFLLTNISNIGNALGWTLIHFLWQGLLIFIGYWTITRLFLRHKVTQQYWVGMFFILLSLVIPFREFVIQLNVSESSTNIIQLIGNNINTEFSSGIMNPLDLLVLLVQKMIPYMVILWLISVMLISGHLFQSWLALLRLSKNPSKDLPKHLFDQLEKVTEKLRIKTKPIITISETIDIPATFGFFKPVILLPFSLVTKLPPEQIEAILIHELCHIKRADFLHNILQILTETLFFYHPLIKWLSTDIRKIREQCCDEMVLKLKTNPITYANALTNIASIYNKQNKHNNSDISHLQIAASDGELFNRIKLLMLEKRSKSPFTNIMLGLLFSVLALIVINNIVIKTGAIQSNSTVMQNDDLPFNSMSYRPEFQYLSLSQLINQKNEPPINSNNIIKSTNIPDDLTIKGSQIKNLTTHESNVDENKITNNLKIPLKTKELQNNSNKESIGDITTKNLETMETIIPSENRVIFPKIIKKIPPIYSRLARSRGIEGNVILSFNIDKKGRVKKISVDKSSPLKLLDGSAKSALRKWRFDPNSINVSNINHRYQQIFSFNLNKTDNCTASLIGTRLSSEHICQDI